MSTFSQIIAAYSVWIWNSTELKEKIPALPIGSKYPIGLTGVHLIATVSIACSDIDRCHVSRRKGLIIGCSGWLNTADSA